MEDRLGGGKGLRVTLAVCRSGLTASSLAESCLWVQARLEWPTASRRITSSSIMSLKMPQKKKKKNGVLSPCWEPSACAKVVNWALSTLGKASWAWDHRSYPLLSCPVLSKGVPRTILDHLQRKSQVDLVDTTWLSSFWWEVLGTCLKSCSFYYISSSLTSCFTFLGFRPENPMFLCFL